MSPFSQDSWQSFPWTVWLVPFNRTVASPFTRKLLVFFHRTVTGPFHRSVAGFLHCTVVSPFTGKLLFPFTGKMLFPFTGQLLVLFTGQFLAPSWTVAVLSQGSLQLSFFTGQQVVLSQDSCGSISQDSCGSFSQDSFRSFYRTVAGPFTGQVGVIQYSFQSSHGTSCQTFHGPVASIFFTRIVDSPFLQDSCQSFH